MKIRYTETRLKSASKAIVANAERIVEAHAALGIQLTLRSLYYQFVTENLIPNSIKSYKNFGHVLSEARKGGFFDWDSIVDQHRPRIEPPHFSDLRDKIESSVGYYRRDRWLDQPKRVLVMLEKDALRTSFEPTCWKYSVPLFINKGYNGQSAMHEFALELKAMAGLCEEVIVLYIGDHDPSGVDMTRDVRDRLDMFGVGDELGMAGTALEVKRIALTMDQIRRFKCPPNPVALKPKPGKTRIDARTAAYIEAYGKSCWEVDAMPPKARMELIEAEILSYLDLPKFEAVQKREAAEFGEFIKALEKIPTYRKAVKAEAKERKSLTTRVRGLNKRVEIWNRKLSKAKTTKAKEKINAKVLDLMATAEAARAALEALPPARKLRDMAAANNLTPNPEN